MPKDIRTDLLFEDLHQHRKKFSPSADRIKAERLLGSCFKQQVDFINDPSRFKSLLCPRRAGKSHAAAIYLLSTCLLRPNSRCVFATLTQKTARSIIWEALKRLDKFWQLEGSFHNTNLSMTLPNGSVIQLAGAESRSEIDKFRGTSYDLFVLDECKSFPPRVITELCDQVVLPALSDTLGTIALMGTPGNALKGVFYEATCPNSPIAQKFGSASGGDKHYKQWSFHSWTTRDNSKMPHIWEDQLALKKRKGWSDENPIWQREFLGRWVADDDAFVYKFSPFRNLWEPEEDSKHPHGLPNGHDWEYVLGCDFGWEDPFAIVVSAFSWTHPVMFEVYSYKERHMHVADIARKIAEVTDMFGEFAGMVGDSGGMGRMVIEELNSIYGIAIDAAEKTEKRDYIELLNSDLLESRIKIRPQSDLGDEWSALVWKDGDKEKENESFSNHLCFVAGTMVQTEEGPRPIECIKIGERVWTRYGLRSVLAAEMTHPSTEVWRVETESGHVLEGTPDHPVWTQDGWKAIRDLSRCDTLTAWENTVHQKPGRSVEKSSGAILNQLPGTCGTISIPRIEEGCTAQSGSTIGDRFPMGSISITETETLSIIASPISNASPGESTCQCTCGNQGGLHFRSADSIRPAIPQKRGMAPQRDMSGMSSMGERSWPTGRSPNSFARSAEVDLSPNGHRQENAPLGAAPRPDENPEWMTSTSSAKDVGPPTEGIVTDQLPPTVPCRVREVRQHEFAPVFNLTVDEHHEYFANRLLVSNCDAFLYSWRYCWHHYFKERKIPPTPGTPEYWKAKSMDDIERAIERRHRARAETEAWSDTMNDELGYSHEPAEQEEGVEELW